MASNRGEASKRVVAETQKLYASVLARPLDEKQLARPTFKFIQETVKSLITETRTLRSVFNPSDFDTDNKAAWDKRRRVEFVQRLIDFAANHKQPVVGCVAAKLVAGLDANKANELLQSLARIALERASSLNAPAGQGRTRTFTKQTPNESEGPGPVPASGSTYKQSQGGGAAAPAEGARRPSVRAPQSETGPRPVIAGAVRAGAASIARPVGRPAARGSGSAERRPAVGSRGSSATRFASAGSRASSAASGPETRARRTSAGSAGSTAMGAAVAAAGHQQVGAGGNKAESIAAAAAGASQVDSRPSDDGEGDGAAELANKQTAAAATAAAAARPPSQHVQITSESDVGKHLQQLRSSLRLLAPVLMDVNRVALALVSAGERAHDSKRALAGIA